MRATYSDKAMPKPRHKIARKLKQLGAIQVNDWDFMALLNTDIKNLELSRSLRRLGQIRVTDWDFKDVVPAVKKVAKQEVDILDILKRTANYRVNDWDFKNRAPTAVVAVAVPRTVQSSGQAEMSEITLRLKNFLQYVVLNLIDEPDRAQIKVVPLKPTGLRFRLILTKKDMASVIGKQGLTAAAIRGLLKSMALGYQVVVLLQIHSHEEEMLLLAKGE